jgi:large subunit ribosomal protein L33
LTLLYLLSIIKKDIKSLFYYGEGEKMREKVILVCERCLSRNYSTYKNKNTYLKRLEIKKFCPKCNMHTLHKESK